jgi:hypothetical protein
MLEKKRIELLSSTVQNRLERTLSRAQETRKVEPPLSKEQKPEGLALRKAEKP